MKKRVGVVTEDNILYNKIRLLLRNIADVELLVSEDIPCDLVFFDIDTAKVNIPDCIRMSRHDECDIRIPFRHEEILSALENSDTDTGEYITLSGDGRNIYLGKEKIKLTDVEYRLLKALVLAKSDFVSREELLYEIWGEGFDAGVVNVYVHYLRNKLEKDGRKILLSSRKEGYGIDKKYRRGR